MVNFKNTMTSKDYLELANNPDYCVLLTTPLPSPMTVMYMGRDFWSKEKMFIHGCIGLKPNSVDTSSIKFFERESLNISQELKRMLERSLKQYTFRVVPSYVVTGDMYSGNVEVLNAEKLAMQFMLKAYTARFADVEATKNGQIYGRVHLTAGIGSDTGQLFGFSREVTWDKEKLADQLMEDVNFCTTVLDNGLQVLTSRYFPETKKSVESLELEIKPNFEEGRLKKEKDMIEDAMARSLLKDWTAGNIDL